MLNAVDSADAAPARESRNAPPEPLRERAPQAPAQAARGTVAGLAGQIGNRQLGRVLARLHDGEGILDGGVVHPDIEAAVGRAAGGGRSLDDGLSQRLGSSLGGDVGDVRVHDGPEAAMLARAVSARAFTVGNDIFFGAGEYRPGTADGDRLVAHEATHVIQQRGAPASGPLTVTNPGDALEHEAEAVARDFSG
jgi:hypothetical protein